MTQVAILGAGIAGLSSAWLLQQHGIDFVILEKQAYIGGLARSFQWHGFSCDFAAHRLFTTDEAVLQQLLNLVPMGRHIRRSRIILQRRWMHDPLDVIELATNLSIPERLKVLGSYLFRQKDLPEDCFKNYVLRRYGRGLYRLFFQPYTEKLFGIPGEEISVYWARQKVRLKNPLDNFRENTKTKFQYFYYPIRGGYGAIVDRLYQEVKDRVLLEASVAGFEREGGNVSTVIYEKDGKQVREPVDYVISTLPLSITGKMLGYPFQFNYQKVDAVYLLINRPLVSDYHWLYFVDSDIAINRMVEFKNMSATGAPQDTTVLCAEVTQRQPDPAAKVVEDLSRLGLIRIDEVLDTKVVQEKFAYPIYDKLYDETIQEAQSALSQVQNLYLVGRAAEFRHREVDDNFAAAVETVKGIVPQLVKEPAVLETAQHAAVEERKAGVYAVILTRDNRKDLQECLESVLASEHEALQVVVVDNHSEKESTRWIAEQFPAVHVIENEQVISEPAGYNLGFTYALKQGAEYVLMLNDDTAVAPDLLKELLSVAEPDSRAGIVMPKILHYGSKDRVWSSGGRYRSFPPAIVLHDRKQDIQDSVRLIEYAPNCGLLIHRRAFERVGLFDPGYFYYYDDWDFSERLRAHGLNIWYAPEARMWTKATRTAQGPRSQQFWRTYGASVVRFYRRHGRPVWFSLPVHLGYVIFREFMWKSNWGYWRDFRTGIKEGLQKPLGALPQYISSGAENIPQGQQG